MAVIRITDIPLEVRLGALPEEQVSPQTVRLDLEIDVDTDRAAASDRLDQTVNYIDVVEVARAAAGAETYHLVESLVRRVLHAVAAVDGVRGARARVRKVHLPGMGDVGCVEIEDASTTGK